MNRLLSQFAADCGGTLVGEDREFRAVSTDTRTVAAGELFVALRGPRFDGAAFVGQAQAAGAAGAVVETGALPGASIGGVRGLGALPLVVVCLLYTSPSPRD